MALRKFTHGDFNLNVLFDENNNPLFIGKEVAEILGYANTNDAIQRHVDPEDKLEFRDLQGYRADRPPLGGLQPHQILINETGFYSLVFQSSLPQAKAFRKWVLGEVLPQIRKTGRFSLDNGFLKLRDISQQDLDNMNEFERKEFKQEIKKFSELLKDPEAQRRGHIGGIMLWKQIKAKEEKLDVLEKKIEDVLFILKED